MVCFMVCPNCIIPLLSGHSPEWGDRSVIKGITVFKIVIRGGKSSVLCWQILFYGDAIAE